MSSSTKYKVIGAYATVAVAGATGTTVLGFNEGAVLPDGCEEASLEHLLDVGLIAPIDAPEAIAAGPSGQQPQGEGAGDNTSGNGEQPPAVMTAGADPAEFNADVVLTYLATADDDERQRILAAEAEGKARKGVLSFEPPPPAE